MSPPEIDLAPELIGQVLDAVDKGFERQLAFHTGPEGFMSGFMFAS